MILNEDFTSDIQCAQKLCIRNILNLQLGFKTRKPGFLSEIHERMHRYCSWQINLFWKHKFKFSYP